MIREITGQGTLELRKIRAAEDVLFFVVSKFRRAAEYENLLVYN